MVVRRLGLRNLRRVQLRLHACAICCAYAWVVCASGRGLRIRACVHTSAGCLQQGSGAPAAPAAPAGHCGFRCRVQVQGSGAGSGAGFRCRVQVHLLATAGWASPGLAACGVLRVLTACLSACLRIRSLPTASRAHRTRKRALHACKMHATLTLHAPSGL